ncbi:MAG: hypothetical protein M1816_003161 [Peltula sp. TS41687]|nr:MAG: hypothetical protein M1816_003161 [Peltula sp. TS41687]
MGMMSTGSWAECKNSLAITDAQPDNGQREMKICANYFTHPWTIQSLDSKELKKNPSRRENPWCQPGHKFHWFSVRGETLLHEMTHFDGVARSAGYPERSFGNFRTRGTEDVGGLGDDPAIAARRLADILHNGQDVPQTLEPWRNAESLATSTLEWYFSSSADSTGLTSSLRRHPIFSEGGLWRSEWCNRGEFSGALLQIEVSSALFQLESLDLSSCLKLAGFRGHVDS